MTGRLRCIIFGMAQKRIAIVTDSTCDIPQSLIDQYGIIVQPHVVVWGDEQLRDRVDIQAGAFYRRLVSDPVMPTTSQATVADFAGTYRRAVEQGADEIVAVIVSGALSGAIQSAAQAKEFVDVPVHIHDSRGATMGLGWQVLAAARARDAGGSVEAMIAAAEAARKRMQLFILLDTLEYIYRGGRIGNASRLVGTMLNVKPMITLDHESGIVEPLGFAMTRRRGLDLLVQKFFSCMEPGRMVHVAVLHGDAEAEAAALEQRVREEYHPAELVTTITCPILGIHTGPRAVALCGYSE